MADYTLFADDDKKQVDGTAYVDSETVIDGGAAFALGTSVPSGPLTDQLQLGGRAAVHGSQVVKSKDLFGAFQSSKTTITSVADDGNGKADFTLVSHGLSVGDVINVTGSTSGNVDGVQKITSVPDDDSFVTDKDFTASATAGSYQTVAGTFATLTEGTYLMRGYTQSVAGGQYTYTGFGADHGIRRSIHKLEAMRTRRVATAIRAGYWNIYTGEWSTDPTVADDISDFGTDDAATPTYAKPGELVYRTSGQQDGSTGYGVTEDDYAEKTG